MSEQTRGGYPIVLTTTARNFYYLRTSRSIFFQNGDLIITYFTPLSSLRRMQSSSNNSAFTFPN